MLRQETEQREFAVNRLKREQRLVKQLRLSVLVLIVFLILMCSLTWLALTQKRQLKHAQASIKASELEAFVQRDQANAAKSSAIAEAKDAQEERALSVKATIEALKQRDVAKRAQTEAIAQRNEANHARVEAERQGLRADQALASARSRELSSFAIDQLTADPQLSLLLAMEANNTKLTTQAENALRLTLSRSHIYGVLRGHSNGVRRVVFSPSGRYIATLDSAGIVRIWNGASGALLSEISSNTSPATCLSFGHNEKWLAAGGIGGIINVWSIDTHTLINSLQASHGAAIRDIIVSKDGVTLLSTSDDGTATLWDTGQWKVVTKLAGHEGPVRRGSISDDGTLILTSSDDGTARVWDTSGNTLSTILQSEPELPALSPTGNHIMTVEGRSMVKIWNVKTDTNTYLNTKVAHISASAFSPNGQLVAIASSDGVAQVWDINTGKEAFILRGHSAALTAVAFSPNGKWVVTVSADRTARLWEASTGQLISELRGHLSGINAVAFSPNSNLIATASDDKNVILWDVSPRQPSLEVRGHSDSVTAARLSSDGTLLVTSSLDKTAKIWEVATGHLVSTLRGHSKAIIDVRLNMSGTRILTLSADSTARIWSSEGRALAILQGHTRGLKSGSFSRDGSLVITSSSDHTAQAWDTSGRVIASFIGHSAKVNAIDVNGQGDLFVTGNSDHTACLWNKSGILLMKLLGHTGSVTSASFSHDGDKIVTSSTDGTARIYRTNGHLISVLRGHTGPIHSAQFSIDGQYVVTASADHTAKVWESDTGLLVAQLRGHEDDVVSAEFSPNGKWVVTGSTDGTARVWDSFTGVSFLEMGGQSSSVNRAQFDHLGTRIATADNDGSARIYVCEECGNVGDLASLFRRRVIRQFSVDERAKYLNEEYAPTHEEGVVSSEVDSSGVDQGIRSTAESDREDLEIGDDRVNSIREPGVEIERGIASWYGPRFNGKRTASGERYDMNELTDAHPSLPFGTRVRVVNARTGGSVVVRINDRGPYSRNRIIDLSYAAARDVGLVGPGTASVRLFLESQSKATWAHFTLEVGRYSDPHEALEAYKKLLGKFPDCIIVSTPGLNTVQVGTFSKEEEANTTKDQLLKMGFSFVMMTKE